MKVNNALALRLIQEELEEEVRKKHPELFEALDSIRKKHEMIVFCTPMGITMCELPKKSCNSR